MGKYNGYVGAPYNFAGLSKKVNRKNKIQPHNAVDDSLKSGRIRYEIEAITPIIISAGKPKDKKPEEFYRDCYGRPAIPGSTLRGLVRSNVQILSCSSLKDDIQNASLMYRNVASGREQKTYNRILGSNQARLSDGNGKTYPMSVLRNVKAGYIRREGGRFLIYPTAVDAIERQSGKMNYYVLSERRIMDNGFKGFEDLQGLELQNKYTPGGSFQEKTRRGKKHYIGEKNFNYRPYWRKVYYSLKGLHQVESVCLAKSMEDKQKAGMRKGCLLSSGFMSEKKAFYVIPEINENGEAIPIPQKDVDSYRRDYEGKKNQIEAIDKKFFLLPEEGQTKPVFYIQQGGKLYFGFTPRLRLFYDNDIHAGLPEEHKEAGVDYCQTLFGYTNEGGSYKSRLSFLDATPVRKLRKKEGQDKMILGGPKPTSYLDYLKAPDGKGGAVSYNDDFVLSGMKQYWLKEEVDKPVLGKNEKVATSIRPYEKGALFQGEIKFTNLTEEELGMVLWGLLLEENSQQNIGKGKPYGYGRIAVRLTGLEILDMEALYSTASLCLEPYRNRTDEKGKYISAAKKAMESFLGRNPLEEPGIQEFLMMKDIRKVPPKERARYMQLTEYQNRIREQIHLQTVKEVVEGKEITASKVQKL